MIIKFNEEVELQIVTSNNDDDFKLVTFEQDESVDVTVIGENIEMNTTDFQFRCDDSTAFDVSNSLFTIVR